MIVQGTPEWYAARSGKVTASRISDILAKTAVGKPSTSRANYLFELLCERLTGNCERGYVSPAMQWGTDQEPFARQAYEGRFGVEVYQVGFVNHPEIAMSGASPDGYVGDCGMVEFKAPLTATHVETLRLARVPTAYFHQIQWQLACAGREWVDFVSFDPRLPEPMQLYVERVPRDASAIVALETEVSAFIRELDAEQARIVATYAAQKAA